MGNNTIKFPNNINFFDVAILQALVIMRIEDIKEIMKGQLLVDVPDLLDYYCKELEEMNELLSKLESI